MIAQHLVERPAILDLDPVLRPVDGDANLSVTPIDGGRGLNRFEIELLEGPTVKTAFLTGHRLLTFGPSAGAGAPLSKGHFSFGIGVPIATGQPLNVKVSDGVYNNGLAYTARITVTGYVY